MAEATQTLATAVQELLARAPALEADALGLAYEELRAAAAPGGRSRRREGASRERGVFYTPPQVSSYMVAAALAASRRRRAAGAPVLLDPSCGAGGFLVAAARAGVQHLVGLDIDAEALVIARAAVGRVAGSPATCGPELELRCADALTSTWPNCDCIVANPPYVSSDTLAAERRAPLRERFADWIPAASKPDLYLYFLARIGEALAEHGAVACVIVPNRVLSGDVAAPLRERLAPFLVEVVDVGHLDVFPAANVHPVVLLLDGRKPGAAATYRLARPAVLAELATAERHATPLRLAPCAPPLWTTITDGRLRALLARVLVHPPLGRTYPVREGMRGGSVSPAAAAALPAAARAELRPEHRGRHIRAYRIEGQGGFYPVPEPAVIAHPGGRLADQLGRKLVIPELCAEVRAAIQTGIVAYGGVYYVPERAARRPLEVLAALLNSRLATVLYRALYQAGSWGGSLKLRTRYLESLPLPESRRHDDELARLAHRLAEQPDPTSAATVDRLVCDLFELSGTELDAPGVRPEARPEKN